MEHTLPKLAAPVDLQWGIEYPRDRTEDGVRAPSANCLSWSWRMEGFRPRSFQVTLFQRTGVRVLTSSASCPKTGFSNCSEDWNDDYLFTREDSSCLESGDYYFTVQALGDPTVCADSEIVRSKVFSYLRPPEALPPVRAVWGDGPSIRLLTPEISAPCFHSYFVKLYREKEPQSHQFERFSGRHCSPSQAGVMELPSALLGPTFVRPGCRAAFQICAASGDVTRCQNGPWSPLAER